MAEFSVSQHFENKDPVVKSIYERILEETRKFGTVAEEPKKTSIHLVNKSAFAGITTRKNALLLNIKSAEPIQHARVVKSEQLSARRFHQEVKLTSAEDVDDLVIGWLREAYAIST